MTDRVAALSCLAESPGAARDAALSEFYAANSSKPLNLLKWLAVQSSSGAAGNVAAVRELLSHPAFAISNPNSCYSLFLGFARSAPNFHAADGSGYEFLADAVMKVCAQSCVFCACCCVCVICVCVFVCFWPSLGGALMVIMCMRPGEGPRARAFCCVRSGCARSWGEGRDAGAPAFGGPAGALSGV